MTVPAAKDLAETLLADLGQSFTLPAVDLSGAAFQLPVQAGNPLYAAITAPDLVELTSGAVGGTGAFDVLMSTQKAHLKEQFDAGRITGDQFAKAYIELTTAAMSTALQFLINGNQAQWQAILLQMQARRAEIDSVTAAVQLETAKAQLAAANAQALTLEAQYVLVLLQAANESAKYDLTNEQIALVKEQVESQRAQTLDTRTDGATAVVGILGKQKALYTQQIDSYKKDSEYKAGNHWFRQRTLNSLRFAVDRPTFIYPRFISVESVCIESLFCCRALRAAHPNLGAHLTC